MRIIKINEKNDALTLDIDTFCNTDYFIDIMKKVYPKFLFKELSYSLEILTII